MLEITEQDLQKNTFVVNGRTFEYGAYGVSKFDTAKIEELEKQGFFTTSLAGDTLSLAKILREVK